MYEQSVRVYWEDTDAGGVVYYANYLKFMERARSDWLTSLGVSQTRLADEQGCLLVVRQVLIDYHQPARLEDLLRVSMVLESIGAASLSIRQQIHHATRNDLLVEASVKVACIDAERFKARRLPNTLRRCLSENCLN